MSLLHLDDVSVDLPLGGGLWPSRKRIDILSGISLTLGRGETLGLVGESGSGKTTLARAVLGLQSITGGRMEFDGKPLSRPMDFVDMRPRVAMMFQDAQASLSPRMTVGALVTEPMVIHRVKMVDRRAKAAELLQRVGLSAEFARRYPHELSGGQARRVGVARALALEPALVIADEPTAGLDVSVQAEILNLMSDLKARMGLSYLVITHNLSLVRHIADRVAVMYLGRLVETGPTRAVFGRPFHPYSASLIDAEPLPDPRKRREDLAIKGEIPSVLRRPQGCEFHTRCPAAGPLCRVQVPELREVAPGRLSRCHYAEAISENHQQKQIQGR